MRICQDAEFTVVLGLLTRQGLIRCLRPSLTLSNDLKESSILFLKVQSLVITNSFLIVLNKQIVLGGVDPAAGFLMVVKQQLD